jgi:hypothetical protein
MEQDGMKLFLTKLEDFGEYMMDIYEKDDKGVLKQSLLAMALSINFRALRRCFSSSDPLPSSSSSNWSSSCVFCRSCSINILASSL